MLHTDFSPKRTEFLKARTLKNQSWLNSLPLTPLSLDSDELNDLLNKEIDLLGLIHFASKQVANPVPNTEVPLATVGMPSMNESSLFQAWPASGEVMRGEWEGIKYSSDNLHIMGVVTVDPTKSVTQGTFEAYSKVLELIKELGYSRLSRVWNFVPEIVDIEIGSGMQRYKAFCRGRNLAYMDHGLEKHVFSSATGIGPRGGNICIMFIASKGHTAMTNLENPLQISAFNYPKKYGIKAPSFARATFEERPDGNFVLYISGTASIRDTETVHQGDVVKQTEVTIENIEALISQANLLEHSIANAPDLTLGDVNSVIVYVKDAPDMPLVERICSKSFPAAEMTVVQADVCRPDLLVEIEGTVTGKM